MTAIVSGPGLRVAGRHEWARPPALVMLWVALAAAMACRQTPPVAAVDPGRADREWRTYGGADGRHYSPLDQINRTNVSQLKVAWTFDTGESGGLQCNPLVVGGMLYATTPAHRAIALDAATGTVRWTFDPDLDAEQLSRARYLMERVRRWWSQEYPGRGPNRGVTFWTDGHDRRLFVAAGPYLYALDAATGVPVPTFGDGGRIDLRTGLDRDPKQQDVRLTSPPALYRDTLIVGGRVSEGTTASPGHIRAYDARTGRIRWTFHTIPYPGEVGYDTWSPDSWKTQGAANNWAGMVVDEVRGLVFVPTGSAAPDFYGGNRVGDNLFADTLLALNAETGQRVWHYQLVKHDIWDRDLPAPPTLVSVRHGARIVDAVAQTTKQGYLFLFNRDTGEPLFPIEQRAVPATDISGEAASPTQPFPLLPAPFARQELTRDMLTHRTPAAHDQAVAAFARLRSHGAFVPLTDSEETVVFPGFDGGAEWGGNAYDPQSGLLFVNANDVPWTGQLAVNDQRTARDTSGRGIYVRECAACHGDDRGGAPPAIPSLIGVASRRSTAQLSALIVSEIGRMPGFPSLSPESVRRLVTYVETGKEEAPSAAVGAAAGSMHGASSADAATDASMRRAYARAPYRFTGYKRFIDGDGYPAVDPPWGTLNAIDLVTGTYAWRIPLGEYPELAARGVPTTGTENYGGPIVTAGGLVFIGATNHDRKFRAIDSRNGAVLWETTLPFSANATPATYEINGRQYVVIAAGGGKTKGPSGGVFVAFALPDRSGGS